MISADAAAEPEFQFHREKFLDVLHYVCAGAGQDRIGRVKLHKILYFADMLTYLDTGKPLTGVEYRKQAFGPVATHLSWGLDALEEQQRIRTGESDFYGYRKLDVQVLAEPAAGSLSASERRLLDEVVDFVCAHSAKAISELSHNAAWELSEVGEPIPYFTAFGLLPVEVTEDDVDWGAAEARRILSEPA